MRSVFNDTREILANDTRRLRILPLPPRHGSHRPTMESPCWGEPGQVMGQRHFGPQSIAPFYRLCNHNAIKRDREPLAGSASATTAACLKGCSPESARSVDCDKMMPGNLFELQTAVWGPERAGSFCPG